MSAAAVPGRPTAAALRAGFISTVAGGVGGPARATRIPFNAPGTCATVQYAAGHLYIGDQGANAVRVVNVRTDWLRTPAGAGGPGGYSGDRGPAVRAQLRVPCAATVDPAGNIVIADKGNGGVRVVAARTGRFFGRRMVAGNIYTVMNGGAQCKTTGASGHFCPVDVIADHNGNVLVSSEGTEHPDVHRIPQIIVIAGRSGRFYGRSMRAGGHYLLADSGGGQLAIDRAGNILATSGNVVIVLAERTGRFYGQPMRTGHIYVIAGRLDAFGYSGDGGPARKARLDGPAAVAVDGAGNVVIGDTNNDRIRLVAARTGRFYGRAMRAGDIYTIAGGGHRLTANGIPARQAWLISPDSVAVDGWGNVAVSADLDPALARVIATRTGRFYGMRMNAGDIYTVMGSRRIGRFAGEGGPATRAQLGDTGVAVDPAGNLLLMGDGLLRVVPARSATFYGRPMTARHIYPIAGGGHILGNGGPALKARIGGLGVAVDAAGNPVISDARFNQVRVVAARTGTFYGQAMKAGDIYRVAGNAVAGFSGDGGPATSAELNGPEGLSIDAHGNLVIVDSGNLRIRVVAAATGTSYGQAMTAGDIYTVAGNGKCGSAGDGGPATAAEFCIDVGVAVDHVGNLVIGDEGNNRVRLVAAATGTFYGQSMAAGDVYTVAGDGVLGAAGDGGPATSAELGLPVGVAVDGAGDLVIGDLDNNKVRVVAVRNGTFYGRPMTAGDIYTVAGTGILGLSGDGGPAIHAELATPDCVAIDHHGNILMHDGNGRIRLVRG